MKRTLPLYFRGLLVALVLLFSSGSSFASHIVGGDIYYTHITGLTYRITVVLYGDCGPASAGAFAGLPGARPDVCIYDGTTLLPGMPLALRLRPFSSTDAGEEITPVCEEQKDSTQCTNTSFAIPGIMKFVYDTVFTLPSVSANWRFVFNSNLGASGTAGRAAAITNIGAGTGMQLEATLNNTIFTNTSPLLTVVPTPFFCLNTPICYTPGAIDPDGDSLRFDLIPAIAGTATCAPAGPVTYTSAVMAFGTTPISATTPLRCAFGSYSFNTLNGQVCFNPNFTQRAIVVYNISEYRGGLLVGTSQREMTYLVQTCEELAPEVDTVIHGGVIIKDGPTDYHVCGNAGAFDLELFMGSPTDPTLNITCTITGLHPAITPTITGNGTPSPVILLNGNASMMSPGIHTFFINLKDDACPINGNNTIAYTIQIYPVPAVSANITTAIDCTNRAVVTVTPGGQGSPWTIKVLDSLLAPPADTVASYTTTVPVLDYRDPGKYYYVIYTNVSTECSLMDSVTVVAPPRLEPIADTTHPSHCGKNDGSIGLYNLNPGGIDTVTYDKYGIPQPPLIMTVSPSGTLIIPNLRAGIYTNIVVRYGYCTSLPIGPVTLVDPPFTIRATTSLNPSKCGFCDGWIKIHGLHPDQLDTITYNRNGVPQAVGAYYISADSSITLNGLCDSTYTTFTVRTAGVCTATLPGPVNLVAPPIGASFDTLIKYGCKGDTLTLINNSFPASELTYSWDFGDGGTATGINPIHVYTNTVGSSYIIKLYATNTKCLSVDSTTLNLNHFVNAAFTQSPIQFVCQIDTMTFANTSTGTDMDFRWIFGDGYTDTASNLKHLYANMGKYNTMLIAHNVTKGKHCYDTMVRSIDVDSNTILTLNVSGDVTGICRSQAVTLTATYSNSGFLENLWDLTDGFKKNNENPLMHSFDGTGAFKVNFNAKFRACPEKAASLDIHVFDVPGIYLGPDTAICPSGSPIVLQDNRNKDNSRAKWRWNIDETERGSSIKASKPGIYVATVTIDGCSMSDTIEVKKDCYVEVPNVFTPNGDGVNDYFFPRRMLTRSVVEFKLNIYNRWGQLIYETKSLDGQGWDGALNGQPQPAGVYIYMIDATFKDGMVEQHKGNVTLLR